MKGARFLLNNTVVALFMDDPDWRDRARKFSGAYDTVQVLVYRNGFDEWITTTFNSF